MRETMVVPKPTVGERAMGWMIKKTIKTLGWLITAPFRMVWAVVKKL